MGLQAVCHAQRTIGPMSADSTSNPTIPSTSPGLGAMVPVSAAVEDARRQAQKSAKAIAHAEVKAARAIARAEADSVKAIMSSNSSDGWLSSGANGFGPGQGISSPGVAVTQSGSAYPSPAPQASRTPLTADQERQLGVLRAIAPERGAAVGELARLLITSRRCSSFVDALELSAELLAVESDQTCAAVSVLLSDGWSDGIGALLACARKL